MVRARSLWLALAVIALTGRGPLAAGQSLARVVADAPAGAVVTVSRGVHHGGLKLTRPITLVGRPGAVIDGDGKGDVIRISSPNVIVRGLTLRGSGTSLTDENAGIFVEKKASGARIEDNDLSHVLFGIYLDGSTGTRVIGNRIRGMSELRVPDRGDGIHLWNDTGVVVQGNDVGGSRDGIYIYVSPHNRIVGNVIHDVRYGVHYMFSNHDLLENNRSYRNVAGFALMMSDHLRIIGNVAEHDEEYGLLLNYITYSELADNRVRNVRGDTGFGGFLIPGGAGKGLFVYDSEHDRFHGNLIEKCPIGVHVTAGSDDDEFYDNAFIGNRIQVKYVQNEPEEWSRHGVGNYWSDYRGWDFEGDGIGDVPYQPDSGVDVLLWKYPQASLLMSSPAILVLRLVQRAFPVFTPPGIVDSHPLMKPPAPDRGA
jgi:nitrous oxidase accessory protein